MHIGLTVCGIGLFINSAFGQSATKFYDKNGNYRGQLSQEGSRLVERDRDGNRGGSYQQEGGKTVYRDRDGNRVGSSSK